MTDIYQAIKADHDKARDLMAQIMDTSNEAVKTRTDMFEDFKLDLWAHQRSRRLCSIPSCAMRARPRPTPMRR